ncbi:hypothetical protein P4388_07770 [Bacillus thuringiensis]|uniref:hypothetical protein n=1 Tax=Bacillus thuringiensis TaxID=1428 RepID=UPI000A39A01B|nr:hypothetical protein [Bacillus thuringiensis]MED3348549.1 hypothetical protein [Bacillus thuringiensis]MRB07812.1 hypothetical protein [Bacillus thuringiensis]OTW90325.1 hypothetical protein BK710_06470 [Bacillus thuringiensis serovar sumiyoshiensis]OTW96897.1 hypothetical protein BK711_18520 [Bacillus thuringiensis serovar fukuokaensis]PEB13582.1 hypothetical protein COM67_05720 [Bacillus thuringiensis]
MATKFNFTSLQGVYLEGLDSDDKMTAFEININKGRFVFIMFLSEEDSARRDELYIHLRRINKIIKLKTYGNHLKGNFEVWIKEKEKEDIISELGLQKNGTTFDFKLFLEQLNDKIPNTIPKEEKIKTIRANKGVISELGIDENDKIILIGTKHLSIGTPQDKTLRKLYLYTDSEVEIIEDFIERLKETNSTVAWTTEDKRKGAPDIRNLINGL